MWTIIEKLFPIILELYLHTTYNNIQIISQNTVETNRTLFITLDALSRVFILVLNHFLYLS